MADDEPQDQTQHSKRWVIAVVAPVFYVLSVGPVVWIFRILLDRIPPASAERLAATTELVFPIVYAPLIWASERVPWLERQLEWYVNLI